MVRKFSALMAGTLLAILFFGAPAANAAPVTCAVGGTTTPAGWTLYGVGGGVAATTAPFISPSGSATDCYIVTDTGGGWPGSTTTGFDISTFPGIPSIPSDPPNGIIGTTNGSAMVSPVFTANPGQVLRFDFAFITNDGTMTFSDWAAAFLLPVDALGNPTGASSLNLFTARTSDNNQVVPGFGFSGFPSGLVLSPTTSTLQGNTFCLNGLTGGTDCTDPGATQFGPNRYPYPGDPSIPDPILIGGSAPWVDATFNFDALTAGTYELVMAVGNVGDEVYSSGLLFGGQSITGGSPAEDPEDVPEPGTITLLGIAMVALWATGRRHARRVN
jgi:PEP-CTERM motif-containing protein